jgi:CRISPR/Cas system CMR-associated protein Cmr3 (group 5 of RAMP superfamily)
MWMAQTDDVSFPWMDGYTYNIKDIKTYPVYDQFVSIALKQNEHLDEIASRTEIFGVGSDALAYLLFEANVEKITENEFDLNKLRTLKIPVLT